LDTIPDNRTEIDSMDKIWRLLTNAYPKRTYTAMLEARCDGMTSYGSTFQGNQQDEVFDFMRGGFYWMPHTPSDCDDSHERFWEASYGAISYCNFALEAIEKYKDELDPEQMKMARAEARISRAYNHFMLLSMFSNLFDLKNAATHPGVPYVTETEDETFKQYDRETVAITLEKIKKDLFEEIDNIGTSVAYQQPKFRFTQDAAYAFAVRFCLFTGDYQGAVYYANKVFPVATTFTQPVGETNSDGTDKIYVATNDVAYQYAGNNLFDMVEFAKTGVDLYQPGIMYTNPQNNSYLLMIEVETLSMRTFLGTLLSSYAYDLATLTGITARNVTGGSWAITALRFTGDPTGFIIKYYEDMLLVNEAAGIGYVYNKVNLFRLEEILLARAEAHTMLGNFQEAINDLNLYTQKKISGYNYTTHRLDKDKINNYYSSRLSDSFVKNEFNEAKFTNTGFSDQLQRGLILAIMDFRRAEFIFEGMRYLDVLRWNIPVSHTRVIDNMTKTLYPDDDNRILQLPPSTQLSGLEPNPMEKIREPWPGINYNE
jgi:hypothetical protein